ncbi:unnamed protein product [Knipowitschia caucasica]
MLRRSQRLIEQGYYGPDGNPVISYKENLCPVFKRRKHRSSIFSAVESTPNVLSLVRAQEPETSVHQVPTASSVAEQQQQPTMRCLLIFCRVVLLMVLCFSLSMTFNRFKSTASSQTVESDLQAEVSHLKHQFENIKRVLLPPANSLRNFTLESLGVHVVLTL